MKFELIKPLDTTELDTLIVPHSGDYDRLISELQWNIDNNKDQGAWSKFSYVVETLRTEKNKREQEAQDQFGGRTDIGCYMYVISSRINTLESFTVYFNNRAGRQVSNAKEFINNIMKKNKDTPEKIFYELLLTGDEDKLGYTGLSILNNSLGHL